MNSVPDKSSIGRSACLLVAATIFPPLHAYEVKFTIENVGHAITFRPFLVSGILDVTSRHNTHLSVVMMLLPTNHAFVGLDSFPIPKKRGTHVFYLPAYDAGTEINDEVPSIGSPLDCFTGQPGYPVDPLGNTGVGGTGVINFQANDRVHIHRGNLGDAGPTGGISDLDSRVHRWLNPVVKLTIVVKPRKNKHGDDDWTGVRECIPLCHSRVPCASFRRRSELARE